MNKNIQKEILNIQNNKLIDSVENNNDGVKQSSNEVVDRSLKKLSFILFALAVVIELGLVGSGFAASYVSGNGEFSLVTVFLGLIALGELTALFSVDALARAIKFKKKFKVKFLAACAVAMAMSFTFFNLFHISMIVEAKESGPLESFSNQKIELQASTQQSSSLINKQKTTLEAKKNNTYRADFLELNQKELNQLDTEEIAVSKAIKSIKDRNYSSELNTQNYLLNNNRAKIKDLQHQIVSIDENYKYELNNLREDRYKEIMGASIFSKQQAKKYYEELRTQLDKKYNRLKAPHLSQIASITKENEAIKKLISSYANLSPQSIIDLEKAEAKLAIIQSKRSGILKARSGFYINKEKDIADLEKSILEHSSIIDKNQQQIDKIINEENKFKKESWLLKLASNYYKKSISEISLQEFKDFGYWFILASALSLAFLPKALVILSVGIENNPIEPTPKVKKKNKIKIILKYFYSAKKREDHYNKKYQNKVRILENEKKSFQESANQIVHAAEAKTKEAIQAKAIAENERDLLKEQSHKPKDLSSTDIKKIDDIVKKNSEQKREARPKVVYRYFPDYSEHLSKKSNTNIKASSSFSGHRQPTGFAMGPKFRSRITKRFIKN